VAESGFSVAQIVEWTAGRLANAQALGPLASLIRVVRPSPLSGSTTQDCCFFFSKDYQAEIPTASPGVLITAEPFLGPLEASGLPLWKKSAVIACKDPYFAMAVLSEKFAASLSSVAHLEASDGVTEVHPSALVSGSAKLASGVKIAANCVIEAGVSIGVGTTLYPGVFIGRDSKIGDRCVLFPHVTLYEQTELGNRVRIHAGSTLGADGFGYAPKIEEGKPVGHQKIYHLGNVVVGDDVEIGANSMVDRATIGSTIIGAKVKIDNHVHIGHNSVLHEGAILCGGVCLAGGTIIGKFAYIGGMAGIGNKAEIGAYSKVGAMSLVDKDVPPVRNVGRESSTLPPRSLQGARTSESLGSGKRPEEAHMSEALKPSYALSGEAIRKFLPHRYPFLLVDKVISIDPKGDLSSAKGGSDKIGTKVVAQKNVSFNEPMFQGHFPGYAIFPGVLTIEAMAQTASLATYPYLLTDPAQMQRGFSVILLGVDEVRFRKPIIPGDVLVMTATLEKCRGSIWGFRCEASVDGAVVAEANILANMTLQGEVKS
jgi:UDP-3-O-[3-hydroxymyristoyl] glucosamine N-acyltransferase